MSGKTYKKSGVDIKKAEGLVSWIKKRNPDLYPGSDYASLFPFPHHQYKNPVLVSATDGVGTKVKLAAYFKKWDTVGQDLVAMCVNDLICVGAKPLFFLDYYACGKLDIPSAREFLKGLERACKKSFCDLVGGETAELPGLYAPGDFDCAGFALGVVEKSHILGAHRVKEGDEIIALKSSGFHSNGYSLLREVYKTGKDREARKQLLLRPTKLYAFLSSHFSHIKGLRALAHITGGGLDNISRIIPEGLVARLNPWKVPSCFLDVKTRAKLSWLSLLKTFNCGLGLVMVLSDREELFQKNIVTKKDVISLGRVVSGSGSRKKRWTLNLKDMDAIHSFNNGLRK